MDFITLDFETYYDKEYSISKLTTEAYVRDPRFEVILVSVKVNDENPTWFSGTMEETRAWLEQFDIPNSMVLAHNARFDCFILSHHFGLVPRFMFDTLSMSRPKHQTTIGGLLKALSDHYTVGVKGDEVILALGKRRTDFTPEELAKYAQYCCNDVQLCYMLFQIMKRDLPKQEFKVIDLLLRMFVDPVLQLDTDVLEEHLATVQRRQAEVLETVNALADKKTLMSNKQFAELLRSLGVEPPMKVSPTTGRETYAFSKTDPAFKELLEHPDERVQAVVAARLGVKSTIEETRTKAFLNIASRGALPIPLGYYKAHTGRAAGEDGINMQNLPRGGKLRQAIKAPEGHVLVVADSTAIEARKNAWLAGQDDLVEDFANGVDIYSKFASEVFGYEVKKASHPVERFVGKTCILGLGYGMGAPKLQRTLKIGMGGQSVDLALDKCKEIVNLYRTKYSRIPALWDAGERALFAIIRGEQYRFGRNGILYTSSEGIHLPNGMVLRYPSLTFSGGEFFYAADRKQQAEWARQRLEGKWQPDLLTRIYGGKVIENVVQALARIVVFDQMVEIARRERVVLTVHDEVVACVAENKKDEVVEFMTTVMSRPPVWAPGLPLACEVNAGKTYGEAK